MEEARLLKTTAEALQGRGSPGFVDRAIPFVDQALAFTRWVEQELSAQP